MAQGKINNTVARIRALARVEALRQVGKARRRADERKHQDGPHPMSSETRQRVYTAQRGGAVYTPLTPTQRRRRNKKLNQEHKRQVAACRATQL